MTGAAPGVRAAATGRFSQAESSGIHTSAWSRATTAEAPSPSATVVVTSTQSEPLARVAATWRTAGAIEDAATTRNGAHAPFDGDPPAGDGDPPAGDGDPPAGDGDPPAGDGDGAADDGRDDVDATWPVLLPSRSTATMIATIDTSARTTAASLVAREPITAVRALCLPIPPPGFRDTAG